MPFCMAYVSAQVETHLRFIRICFSQMKHIWASKDIIYAFLCGPWFFNPVQKCMVPESSEHFCMVTVFLLSEALITLHE